MIGAPEPVAVGPQENVPFPSFPEWLETNVDLRSRPWLILGKGPSFHKHSTFDLQAFATLGLNHVCRELPVTAAHVIDLEVIDQIGPALEQQAGVLVMPWVPHAKNGVVASWITGRPARLSPDHLGTLSDQHPVLRRLRAQGRLLWYNLGSARAPRGTSPVIPVKYFSAEAALNLLGASGVRVVRSLGVDGGRDYSAEFEDLRDTTLLANGRTSFDAQFDELASTLMRTRVSFAPLDVESPIRVFVSATEAQRLAVAVLEYSIRRHTSMDVEVFPLYRAGMPIPEPRHRQNRPRTPFSFQRFLIPSLAGFRGRAISLDSDMLVFRDMARLWTLPFDGADVLTVPAAGGDNRRPQFSVMLLDCDRLRWDINAIVSALDAGTLGYEQLMYELGVAKDVRATIPAAWNALERFDPAETALLHYTDMPTQPWLSTVNPLGHLWTRSLFEAIDCGIVSRAAVEADAAAGYVRPSLVSQLEQRIEDARLLPKSVLDADRAFSPAWTPVAGGNRSLWRRPVHVAASVAHRVAALTGVGRAHARLRSRLSR